MRPHLRILEAYPYLSRMFSRLFSRSIIDEENVAGEGQVHNPDRLSDVVLLPSRGKHVEPHDRSTWPIE
jgi:hypothetical protein